MEKKPKPKKPMKNIWYKIKILSFGVLIGQYIQPIPLVPRTGFEGSGLPNLFNFAENSAHAQDYQDTLGGEIDEAIKNSEGE